MLFRTETTYPLVKRHTQADDAKGKALLCLTVYSASDTNNKKKYEEVKRKKNVYIQKRSEENTDR